MLIHGPQVRRVGPYLVGKSERHSGRAHCSRLNTTAQNSCYPPGNHLSVLFPVHNHLLTTGRPTDDLTLALLPKHQRVKGHQYQWLAGGYDLEIGHF